MKVALYGAGQLNRFVAEILSRREVVEVVGPFGRDRREEALTSGADAVVIATTSFLDEVAPDIEIAVLHGSNVVTSCEEAANPFVAHGDLARRLDALARRHGVTVLGAGLNPGLAFDALVLTAAGACWDVETIVVERIVNLSGFSETILTRLGVGFDPPDFERLAATGQITGHIGFPQSIRVVAGALGVSIERIERHIEPVFAEHDYRRATGTTRHGQSAGFRQRYTASVGGAPWFEARFVGHLEPVDIGLQPLDRITIEGSTPVRLEIAPGLNPQQSSSAVIANSLVRLVAAPPGWLTVANLPPAVPAPPGADQR